MVKDRFIKYLISFVSAFAVAYPLQVWYTRVGGSLSFDSTLPLNIFPAFGLLAFMIMWLHVVGGALRGWLEKYFDFERFVSFSSVAVLLLLFLHPLTLFFGLGFSNIPELFAYYSPQYLWLAIVAWFILVGYDVAKRLKTRSFFARHWQGIKLISTIGFFLTFFHSLGLGSDLRGGALREVWIFYGITAALAALYSYAIKNLIEG